MRTRSKKIWMLALLSAFALLTAACGGDLSEDTSSDNQAEEATEADDAVDEAEVEEATETDAAAQAEDSGEDQAGGELLPGPGFDGETIKVGVLSDFSGPVSALGLPIAAGVRAYIEGVNADGGVAGQYPIEIVELDSQYNPTVAVQAYTGSKDDVVMYASTVGTAVTNALVESLKADNIVAVPGSLASGWVRESNLLPVGAPYEYQAINGLDWHLDEGGGTTDQVYCSFIQDDAAGEAGQSGFEHIAQQTGFTIADTARYVSGDTDFSSQLQQLQAANCEVVFLASTPSVTGAALGGAAQAGFAPRWIGFSPAWINALLGAEALIPYLEANLILVSEGPTWGDTEVAGMVALLEDLEAYVPDQVPDYYVAFGYSQAIATVALLEEAVSVGDLSRDGVATALSSLDTVSFSGLMGDYNYGEPGDRVPPGESTIFAIDAAAPNGIRALATNYESEYVASYDLG